MMDFCQLRRGTQPTTVTALGWGWGAVEFYKATSWGPETPRPQTKISDSEVCAFSSPDQVVSHTPFSSTVSGSGFPWESSAQLLRRGFQDAREPEGNRGRLRFSTKILLLWESRKSINSAKHSFYTRWNITQTRFKGKWILQ